MSKSEEQNEAVIVMLSFIQYCGWCLDLSKKKTAWELDKAEYIYDPCGISNREKKT